MANETYKYDNAHEWLMEYAAKLDASKLLQEFSVIAAKLDGDTIQELYEYDMDKDGFFKPIRKRG